jgi:hypothetical protein
VPSGSRLWALALPGALSVVPTTMNLVRGSPASGARALMAARPAAQVSDHGRFRSTRGDIKVGSLIAGGHRAVKLAGKGQPLHRLICTVWHGPAPSTKHKVVHKDGDPTNNIPDNLEWVTPSQINQYSYPKTNRETSAGDKFKPVRGRKIGTDEWTHFESCSAAARELGSAFDPGSIMAVANGRVKQPGGWTFEFTKQCDEIPGEMWKDVML